MKYIETFFYLVLALITFIFFIPSFFVSYYVSLIIPPIISFIILSYLALKNKSIKGEIINILLHLCMIGCYISFMTNPGTDDSFSGLSDVIDHAVISCVLTFFILILFIAYILVVVIKESKNSLQKQKAIQPTQSIQPTQPIQHNTKFCIHCGTYNDETNEKCTNCGMRLN